jgi:hypothetical protein
MKMKIFNTKLQVWWSKGYIQMHLKVPPPMSFRSRESWAFKMTDAWISTIELKQLISLCTCTSIFHDHAIFIYFFNHQGFVFLKIQTCKSNLVKRFFSKGTNVYVHSFATFRIFCITQNCKSGGAKVIFKCTYRYLPPMSFRSRESWTFKMADAWIFC